MNRRRVTLLTLAFLAASGIYVLQPVAQQPIVDKERSRQELDTMKGILQTTLNYASRRVAPKEEATTQPRAFMLMRDGGSIRSFYLYGQGAVFVIPVSDAEGDGMNFMFDFAPEIAARIANSDEIRALAADATAQALEQVQPPDAADKERAEKQQAQTQKQREKVQKMVQEQKAKLQEQREEMHKRREDLTKRRQELEQRVNQMKVYLKDTLANHGDSLSIVKPDESVTLVITGSPEFMGWGSDEQAETCTVLSVKKSLVTDLKAGKITREEFDRRVLDYTY